MISWMNSLFDFVAMRREGCRHVDGDDETAAFASRVAICAEVYLSVDQVTKMGKIVLSMSNKVQVIVRH